jgi:hypothetical protein
MATYRNDPSQTSSDEEAKRLKAEADRVALERLYGPKSKEAKGQSWIGVALMVLGPILGAVGAAMGGEPAMIAVGIIALSVGVWAFIDGLLRASREKAEERKHGGSS